MFDCFLRCTLAYLRRRSIVDMNLLRVKPPTRQSPFHVATKQLHQARCLPPMATEKVNRWTNHLKTRPVIFQAYPQIYQVASNMLYYACSALTCFDNEGFCQLAEKDSGNGCSIFLSSFVSSTHVNGACRLSVCKDRLATHGCILQLKSLVERGRSAGTRPVTSSC